MPKEYVVESLSEFLERVKTKKEAEEGKGKNADFIFRGQVRDKPLLPKIARLHFLHLDFENREKLMLEEFKRLSLGLTDLIPETDWDYLSLAQHHGLPTRLLDWTYQALPAVYFAVETAPEDDNDAVVWLLKTRVKDFIQSDQLERISPFHNKRTRIYRPRAVARRIVVQGGLFTVHQLRSTGDFLELEENNRYSDRLVKFIIPASRYVHLRNELDGCGVNRASLFPDLDGLCAHLAWRYFLKV
jgi:FRG domain